MLKQALLEWTISEETPFEAWQ